MSTPVPVNDSIVQMSCLVMPNDANPLGTVFGGRVMEWVDIAGGICAQRHCRTPVVLAGLDQMSFMHPIHVGEVALLAAQVSFVANTSLEVGVTVTAENPLTGERRHTSTAWLTYVSLDPRGAPAKVPPLEVETDEARQRFADGARRREARISQQRKPPAPPA